VAELYTDLRDAFNASRETMLEQADLLDAHRASARPTDAEGIDEWEAREKELEEAVETAIADTELREKAAKDRAALDRARAQFKPITTGSQQIQVSEPDMYVRGGRSFFGDLYMAQVKHDGGAAERINKHQALAVEQRAMTSTTMGGLIPPTYMLDLYAKASRNGRVYADQSNNGALPDTGMSVIIPRITTPTAAGVQATENTAVTTQDAVETDLSVNVRTLAGYLPVSRQAIERAAYDDRILFEDLVARYFALLDTQCISGGGGGGTILGVLSTAAIAASTASTATVVGVWPKIADVIQQINTNMGGLGYVPDKIFMHPRRWGFFEAALDTQSRPIFGIGGQSYFNAMAAGNAAAYGADNGTPPVGIMHGLPVYTDANIPTNLGAGTNEDRIIVHVTSVVHLFERAGDPVTLSFEQQAGTSLQVQLVVYGYAAFTAGRYPGASGVVSGAGLVPPTF
jgi:HK97 family phage major capsid protein